MATLLGVASVALFVCAEICADWLLTRLRLPFGWRGRIIFFNYTIAFFMATLASALGFRM